MKNNNQKRFLFWGSVFGGATLLALTLFAVIRSQQLASQAHKYVQLKERLSMLKSKLVEYDQAKKMQEKELLGKNSSSTNTTTKPFIVVNRNFDHLRKSALHFARCHRIEKAVAQLYYKGDIDTSKHRKKLLHKKRLALRHRRFARHAAIAPASLEHVQQEHQFIWPLPHGSYRLGSRFGPRRRPNNSWGWHNGLDMPAARGTIVKSAARGVIVEARMDPRFGNTVVVEHSSKLRTRYAHLSKIDVKTGDFVEQGQRVGRVGNTGNTRGKNGYHLHFEVSVSGNRVDPLYFLP